MAEKNKKIVMIEDDEIAVRMYQLQFEAAGMNLLVAINGQDGVALVKKEKPNLVLLDIKLPDIDGFEVLYQLKNDSLIKNIPVFIFSNVQKTGNVEKAMKLGAVKFIMKSKVLPQEILNEVVDFLKKK